MFLSTTFNLQTRIFQSPSWLPLTYFCIPTSPSCSLNDFQCQWTSVSCLRFRILPFCIHIYLTCSYSNALIVIPSILHARPFQFLFNSAHPDVPLSPSFALPASPPSGYVFISLNPNRYFITPSTTSSRTDTIRWYRCHSHYSSENNSPIFLTWFHPTSSPQILIAIHHDFPIRVKNLILFLKCEARWITIREDKISH
jgi:hypothetical protein